MTKLMVLVVLTLAMGPQARADEPADAVVVAGCQPADYVDAQDGVIIQTSGRTFTPKCIRVRAGSQVSIKGSNVHPIQGLAPVEGVINPFANAQGGVPALVTKTLTDPGFYGFYCTNHGNAQGGGMAGAIQVVP